MGKGTYFVSGVIAGILGTRFVFKHKSEIESFLGIDSSDNTDNVFNDKISMDESITDNMKKGYYAIAKTYAGGDSDRDGSETDSECVSFESEEAVVEGEAGDSHADSESTSEDEKTSKPLYLVEKPIVFGDPSLINDREELGLQTLGDGSLICKVFYVGAEDVFVNSSTGREINNDVLVRYIEDGGCIAVRERYKACMENPDTEPNTIYIHNNQYNIQFIIVMVFNNDDITMMK